jgi:hypothetical protein
MAGQLVKRIGPQGHHVIVFVLARCESRRKMRGGGAFFLTPLFPTNRTDKT